MKIWVFGNEAIQEDSLAKEIATNLKIDNVEFIKCNSAEELLDKEHKEDIIIMDVIKNLDEPQLFEGIDQLENHKLVSGHDFDLGFQLKLLKGIGELKKVKIIGVPMEGEIDQHKEKVEKIISLL